MRWMEKILFRRIELWVVVLIGVLGFVAAIGLGAAAIDAERGHDRYGVAGQVALAIVQVPGTVNKMLTGKTPMSAMNPERFADERPGWSLSDGAHPPPGYLLLSRYDGNLRRHVIELVSLGDGQVRHAWHPDADDLLAGAPASELATEWSTSRWRGIHPFLIGDGNLIVKDHQSYLMRLDPCGQKVWRLDAFLTHHSTESDGNGGFWLPGLIEPPSFKDVEDVWYEDSLAHVDADGNVLAVISLPQIFVENGMEWAIFNAGHRISDPVHLNDIQPVLADGAFWKKGDLFLSMRHLSAIMLYRPTTDKIIWFKQGPWLAQHDVDILDDHRIAVFDNHASDRGLGGRVDGANHVTIFDFRTDTTTGPWDAALAKHEVHTLSEGLVDWLAGGEIMVEEENFGRIVILDRNARLVATYLNMASDHQNYMMGWSRWVDQATGDRALKAIAVAKCGHT